MNKGNLQSRLQRIEGRALQVLTMPSHIRVVFCHALDGRPAGTSEMRPDGRLVWLEPPEGSREGELVTEEEQSDQNRMAA